MYSSRSVVMQSLTAEREEYNLAKPLPMNEAETQATRDLSHASLAVPK
jgi:hypothetical protein